MLQIGPANRKEKMLASRTEASDRLILSASGQKKLHIQVSLDLFQGSQLSFHHFEVENRNVVVGKGMLRSETFFLRIPRIDKR